MELRRLADLEHGLPLVVLVPGDQPAQRETGLRLSLM